MNKPSIRLPDFAHIRLVFEIAFWRYGWILPAALISLAICLMTWIVWLPIQASSASHAHGVLEEALRTARSKSSTQAKEPPLHAFKRQLLPQSETTAQLRTILQLANNAGLTVSQIDMRRQVDAVGVYSQLQVVLPVHGSYLQIKHFCSDLLQAMPVLSIDQLAIRRDQPSAVVLDAQISLSIWQQPGEAKAP